MNIAHIEETSLIYGPGVRFVIWVQGCSIRCSGCWNKEMWSFKKKNELSTTKLLEKILAQKNNEGITILGGEPFDQYEELLDLLKKVRQTHLSIILYTGYSLEELEQKARTEAFRYVDILITDRYDERYRTKRGGLIGSSNQKIHFLTQRYTQFDLVQFNETEISIEENGKITLYGYDVDELQELI